MTLPSDRRGGATEFLHGFKNDTVANFIISVSDRARIGDVADRGRYGWDEYAVGRESLHRRNGLRAIGETN